MREILFRGKNIDLEWVEGDLLQNGVDYKTAIRTRKEGLVERVINHTVSQYTGLTDKNGKKIFEADILEFSDRLVEVFWHAHLGCWDSNFLKYTNKEKDRVDMSPCNWEYNSEVIGNIHDNPELLNN